MESGHKSGNSRHLRSHSEATIDEARLLTPGKKSDSSSSISSADSSLDDYIQVDRDKLSPSTADISGSTILNEDDQLATKDGEKDATGNSCLKSEQTDDGSTGPVAPEVCGLTSVFSLHSGSETKCRMQSPLIQVMERSGDSNSYRIPASVFARSKSTTLMEWSVASNESLFSLHVGNNSLSGDQVFLLSKSGELGKSGELTKSGELINFSPRLPLATAASEADKWSVGMGEGLGVTEAAAETMKGVLRATVEDHSKEKTPPDEGVRHSSSICHHFDGSGTSIQSIAFPIKKKCMWPLCCCSNGSRVFCYCARPNCCCSNSSWVFCSCSKCCRTKCAWPFCCHSNGSCCRKKCALPFCCCCNGSCCRKKCAWPYSCCSNGNCCRKKCAWPFSCCSNGSCCRKKCAWPFSCCSNGSWTFCSCSKCCRKKCAWPFCCRSSGSQAFHCCTWSNCCSSNNTRVFCYCCNCS